MNPTAMPLATLKVSGIASMVTKAGIDEDYVCHRHEGGCPGDDLGFCGGSALFQMEDFFEHGRSSVFPDD